MTTNELLALLRLQNIPNIGDVTAKKLIAHCGSPKAIFCDKKGTVTENRRYWHLHASRATR